MANGTAAALELMKKDASTKIANANRRAKTKSLEQMFIRKGTLLSTSALYGILNRLGVPISVGGFPWKPIVGGLAMLGEGLSKGVMQSILSGVSDATMAIYIERSISTENLVAGHDDGDDDDDNGDGDGGELSN